MAGAGPGGLCHFQRRRAEPGPLANGRPDRRGRAGLEGIAATRSGGQGPSRRSTQSPDVRQLKTSTKNTKQHEEENHVTQDFRSWFTVSLVYSSCYFVCFV